MGTPINKLTLLECLKEIYKKKIAIISSAITITLIIAIGSLFLPNEYKAQANLLPNPNRGIGFDIFSENGGIQNLASSFLGGGSDESNRFYILLESYSTKLAVVNKFDLVKVYGIEESDSPFEDAIDIFSDNLNLESKEEGNFIIQVWDSNPTRARDITQFLVETLNTRNSEISSKEATFYKEFIENRYIKAINELDSLTLELKNFQTQYGVIELPSQVEGYFSLLNNLSLNKYKSEIKIELLKNKVQESSQSYQIALSELEAISNQLRKAYSDTLSSTFELSFQEIPTISRGYFTLVQKVEIQSEILKFVVPLYEQAKMDQVKSLPVVSVVDEPIIPERKDRPKRSIIVILVFISSLTSLVFYTLLRLIIKNNMSFIYSIRN
ncbi:MAG: hypothetical protein BalsKO_25880 [Balneolaceae bacterium]